MIPDPQKPAGEPDDSKFPPADYGNASNPSPHDETVTPADNQLLDKHADKYLGEVANIEDVPDAQDQENMDETMQQQDHSVDE